VLLAATAALLFAWLRRRVGNTLAFAAALLYGLNPYSLVLPGLLHYDVLHLFLLVAGCAALVLGGHGPDAGTGGRVPSGPDPLGVVLALGAGLSYAGYTVGSKRLVSTVGPTGAMAAVFGSAGLLLLPVLVIRIATVGADAAPAGTVSVVVYLAVVPTALAYLLFGRGLEGLHPPVVATLSLAEPLVASILGVAVLGEPVTPLRLAGAAFIFAGLATSMLAARPPRPPPNSPRVDLGVVPAS